MLCSYESWSGSDLKWDCWEKASNRNLREWITRYVPWILDYSCYKPLNNFENHMESNRNIFKLSINLRNTRVWLKYEDSPNSVTLFIIISQYLTLFVFTVMLFQGRRSCQCFPSVHSFKAHVTLGSRSSCYTLVYCHANQELIVYMAARLGGVYISSDSDWPYPSCATGLPRISSMDFRSLYYCISRINITLIILAGFIRE